MKNAYRKFCADLANGLARFFELGGGAIRLAARDRNYELKKCRNSLNFLLLCAII
jgi:hypothetical protein